ncbi:MAG: VWA domain-containing protein, partial [Verrucomicrobiae bacterium]|nr:VWA domain-containing protein [Verrucomicrobiae bacterium]
MKREIPASVRLFPAPFTAVLLGLFACASFGILNSFAQDAPPAASESTGGGKAIIILDASGSMWGQIDGKYKIEIAREVIGDLMQSLNPDLELGLMAYGHRRKGDCTDIELLIPPAKVDRKAFLDRVMGIMPVGKTPLTAAVEQAAEVLKIEENPASIILISDGLETCDRDPCALARALAAKGVAFKAHIIAFDLTSQDAETIRCLADETGGQFLPAQDAASLRDALEMAVTAAAEPMKPAMPEEILDPATVKAPDSVPAGSVFQVEWEGPDNQGDYVTIVPKTAEDRDYGNHAYTR